MIDPTQLPLLLKVLDFLFDEGHKIFQERREKRQFDRQEKNIKHLSEKNKSQEMSSINSNLDVQSKITVSNKESRISSEKSLSTIDELMKNGIQQEVWTKHETELAHLYQLMGIYERNYRLAEQQFAKWGDAMVPQIIVNNLREAELGFIKTNERVQQILSEIYGKPVNIAGKGDSHESVA